MNLNWKYDEKKTKKLNNNNIRTFINHFGRIYDMDGKGLNGGNPLNDIRDRLGFLERHPNSKTNRKTVKWWIWLVVFGLGVLLGLFLFSKSPQTITKTVTVTDTIYRDTGTHVVEFIPKPIYVQLPGDTVFVLDTNEAIQDYLTVRGYDSTLVDDSMLYAHYTEVISRNKSQGLVFTYHLKQPTIINTTTNTTVVLPQPRLYVGGGISFSKDTYDISGGIGLATNKMLYTASYGFLQKEIKLSAYLKIK